MTVTYLHPHPDTQLEDLSQERVHIERPLPIFRPAFYILGESGPPNEFLFYESLSQAKAILGEQTFNKANRRYYSPACDMITKILENGGSCFIARAEDDSAMPSVALMAAEVEMQATHTKYEIDPVTGNFKRDSSNMLIPVMSGGNPVEIKGVNITLKMYTDWNQILKLVYNLDDSDLENDLYAGRDAVDRLVNYIKSNPITHAPVAVGDTWSDDLVTDDLWITQPTVVAPPSGEYPTSPVFYGSPFNGAAGLRHAYTSWQLSTTDTFGAGDIVAEALMSPYLEAWAPDATLTPGNYYLRFKYYGVAVTSKIVPLIFVKKDYPGASGDNFGFAFWYDATANSKYAVQNRRGFINSFDPFKKNPGSINPVGIKNKFGSTSAAFALSEDMLDATSNVNFRVGDVLRTSYNDTTHPLQMEVLPFHANYGVLTAYLSYFDPSIPSPEEQLLTVNASGEITAIAEMTISDLRDMLDGYGDQGMLNILGLRDPDGKRYQSIRGIYTGNNTYTPGNRTYLGSGMDGGLFSKSAYTAQFKSFFNLEINENIEDSAKYPFTDLIDVGYNTECKYAMLDFMSIRPDVFVSVTTNIKPFYHPDNSWTGITTAEQDYALGVALVSRGNMTKESVVFGTNSCRFAVFVSGGYISGIKDPCGMTYWLAEKLAQYDSGTSLGDKIRGLPNSDISTFETMLWIPGTKALRELLWGECLNYPQHYDMSRIHMAGIRTGYKTDGNTFSMLSDFGFTRDVAVYAKHETRPVWAELAGRDEPAKDLIPILKQNTETRLNRLFNGRYRYDVTPYQTENDRKMGTVYRIRIDIRGGAPFRHGYFELKVYKDTQV